MVDVIWYIAILVLLGMIIAGILYSYFEEERLRKENAILAMKLNRALGMVDSYQNGDCMCDDSDSEVPEWFKETEHYDSIVD